jgi:hypothetical protein
VYVSTYHGFIRDGFHYYWNSVIETDPSTGDYVLKFHQKSPGEESETVVQRFESLSDALKAEKNLIKGRIRTTKKVLKLSHYSTGDTNCSEDTLAGAMQFHGYNITPWMLQDMGYESLEQAEQFEPKGFDLKLKDNISIKKIKREIDQGRPVILRIIPEGQEDRHAITIAGYDEDSFYVYDSAYKDPEWVFIEDIVPLWKKTNNLALLIKKKKVKK